MIRTKVSLIRTEDKCSLRFAKQKALAADGLALKVALEITTQALNPDLRCISIDDSACSVRIVSWVFIPLATASGSVVTEPTFRAKPRRTIIVFALENDQLLCPARAVL